MYKDFSVSHTTHSFASVYQLAATFGLSVGHLQAIVQEHECAQVHLASVRFHFQVVTSCQIINNGKRVSCVWLKHFYTFEVNTKGNVSNKDKKSATDKDQFLIF
jgi:hypothetical protein